MSIEQDDRIPAARHRLKQIVTYEVPADEFDRIEQEASTVGTDLQFATLLLSTAVSFTVTLCTVAIANERVYEFFIMITIVGYVVGAFCGVRGWKQRGQLNRLISKIRSSQVGPVGEEGKEIKPTELDTLPLQASPQPIALNVADSMNQEEVIAQLAASLESLRLKLEETKSEKK